MSVKKTSSTSQLDLINNAIKHNLRSWVENLIPGGTVKGHEYEVKNPTRSDHTAGSFKINIETGAWADFSTRDNGGDPQSLYAYIKGLDASSGAKAFIKEHRSLIVSSITKSIDETTEKKKLYKIVSPIPEDVALPFEETDLHWRYKNPDGQTIFVIRRVDKPNGEKLMLPYTYWSDGTSSEWRTKGFKATRPLLGLNLLDDGPVLVVEGEKTYDAARKLVPFMNVVTWCGGAQGVKQSSWDEIRNHQVVIWPDNDDPGFEAAQAINKLLGGKASMVNFDRNAYPEKWDLADIDGNGEKEIQLIQNALALFGTEQLVEIENQVVPVQLEKNDNGVAFSSVDNVMRVLAHVPTVQMDIWFDEFYQKVFVRRQNGKVGEWSDVDDIELTVSVQRHTPLSTVSETTVSRAVQLIAHQNVKNAPRDWLETLKWDQIGRLNQLFERGFGAVATDYVADVSSNFLISMVARIFDPGCKVDTMVVLEGHQGAFKSTGLSVLGGPWFMESGEAMGSKDFLQSLPGKMLIEIAELDSFSKADTRTVKKTLSCRVDRYRPSYGRYSIDFPRQCVFVGTTNEDEYLEDATGGRRFWPIKTRVVDIDWLMVNRDQLFAEAVARYQKNESWWETHTSAATEQSHRRRKDSWEDAVAMWIAELDLKNKDEFTLNDIAKFTVQIVDRSKFGKSEQMRLSAILKVLGAEKSHTAYGNTWKIKPLPSGTSTEQTDFNLNNVSHMSEHR